LCFDEEYFRNRMYSQRERLIKRHVLEVLKWGSKVSNFNLLEGQGKTALDVGCAYGYGVDVLESSGYDSCGVDISKYSVEKAKKLHSTDFIVCDVQKGFPFKKSVFDLLTCFGVVEDLANPLQALKNMFVSCKDTMICTTPNRIVENPIKKVIRDIDETHINVKTQKEWEKSISLNLNHNFLKVEAFLDASLRAADKLLFSNH
jgi:2-polyprenyl-3-methyl-5-hydroxy-6-metoxy-1,4-benzoquinol methylase